MRFKECVAVNQPNDEDISQKCLLVESYRRSHAKRMLSILTTEAIVCGNTIAEVLSSQTNQKKLRKSSESKAIHEQNENRKTVVRTGCVHFVFVFGCSLVQWPA